MMTDDDRRKAELDARERKLERRELALRAQREQHEIVADLGRFFSFVVDVDESGRLGNSWTPGESRLVGGLSIDDLETDDLRRHVHPDDQRLAWGLLDEALATGEATGEYRMIGADGSTIWLRSKVRRVERASGTKLLGIVQDVSDLRRTEAALRASEHSFELMFRKAPVVMLISAVDDGTLVDVNDRFTEIVGYTRAEAIGKTATQLGLWESAQQRDDLRAIRRVSEDGFEGIEAQVRTKSGKPMVALMSAQFVDLSGRRCALWHAVDITQRKAVEEELARYRQDLELLVDARTRELEASRERLRHSERLASIGTLAAGIAHQINNPVGVILTAAQYALDCEGDEDVLVVWKTALEEAESHALRCARIVRSVLQFSREEKTEQWDDDLGTALRRACHLTRAYAEERRAALHYEEPDTPVIVRMNPIEMEQVLVNVLRNAIESKDGADVSAHIVRTRDSAVIVVEDDGQGIEDADLPHVFDPFFTTRLAQGGSGLGLSVAHGIVLAHAGSMRLSNRACGGCCARIELPLSHRDTNA